MQWDDGEAGLTLVEIIISLFVLGLVLTAFFTVITGGLRSLSESRARQTASQVATEIIEDLRRRPPSEIAMYSGTEGGTFDLADPDSGVFCATPGDGQFDPDGPGGIDCEAVVTNTQGAIRSTDPWLGAVDAISVRTVATAAAGDGIPDDTVRVTVVMTYGVAGSTEEIRRSAFFSEVARG